MKPSPEQIEQDAELIKDLGGPAAVADLLNFTKPKGTTRVSQWQTRGIPAQVKVDFPHLFMRKRKAEKATA
jgi:hypothetical protein